MEQINTPRTYLVQVEPRGPSQLIEVPVTTNGLNKIQLPDIQQLRSTQDVKVILKGLRLITDNVLTHAPLGGQPTAPLTELVKMSLVIYCEGWEKGQIIPLLVMNDVAGDGTGVPFRYNSTRFDNWVNVDWSKSYLLYSNTTTSAGTPYSVLFEAEYVKLNNFGKPISGTS